MESAVKMTGLGLESDSGQTTGVPFVSVMDNDELDGDCPNSCPNRANAAALRITADYHQSLLDQRDDSASNNWRKHDLADPQHGRDTFPRCKRTAKWDKTRLEPTNDSHFRPELTQQDIDEFESLPLAIRRKYFSTLERLRLAQSSALNASSHKHTRSNIIGCDLNAYQGARLSQVVSGRRAPRPRPTTSPTVQSYPFENTLSLAKLPAKIREKHLTREEQLLLARQLRESVILDAADEAIYRKRRRLTQQPLGQASQTLREPTVAMDHELLSSEKSQDDMYDCFRWLDEDEDLDLSFVVDDSSHIPSGEISAPKPERGPSFRRHLSIGTKIPFGSRMSSDSSRPATKDAISIPPSPALSNLSSFPQQAWRRSRALSLITPRHTTHDLVASIDPAAAHYQDPEARLKLRVYLSSPQKFDEAIEFGFPSHDSDQEHLRPTTHYDPQSPSGESEHMKTFLADDRSSICSEDLSMSDPESPKTPHTFDQPPLKALPPTSRDDNHSRAASEGYSQAPVTSREMTLRMTLTRPDLRACEDQMYGWSSTTHQPPSNPPRSVPVREDPPPITDTKARPKDSMDRIFADIDQDLDAQSANGGVMKRLWKRVRRG